jgi:hypothetical protein
VAGESTGRTTETIPFGLPIPIGDLDLDFRAEWQKVCDKDSERSYIVHPAKGGCTLKVPHSAGWPESDGGWVLLHAPKSGSKNDDADYVACTYQWSGPRFGIFEDSTALEAIAAKTEGKPDIHATCDEPMPDVLVPVPNNPMMAGCPKCAVCADGVVVVDTDLVPGYGNDVVLEISGSKEPIRYPVPQDAPSPLVIPVASSGDAASKAGLSADQPFAVQAVPKTP